MSEFELLAQRLKQAADVKDIIKIAHQLGDLGDQQAVPILIELLSSTKDGLVRNAAAVGLRELQDNRAVPYLLEQLNADHTRGNRGTLMYALEKLDAPDALVNIVQIMCADDYETIAMGIRVIEAWTKSYQPDIKSQAVQILQDCLAIGDFQDWKGEMLSGALSLLDIPEES
jgi:HEAT repeat protein